MALIRRHQPLFVSIAGCFFVAMACCLVTTRLWAQAQSQPSAPQYVEHTRCGVVNAQLLPPRTIVRWDVDSDGTEEQLVANWGGVELLRLQPGTVPPTLVRQALVLTSTRTAQYSCVDLRIMDVDGDGALDVVFASPAELVVALRSGGAYVLDRREALSFAPTERVRIVGSGSTLSVEAVGR